MSNSGSDNAEIQPSSRARVKFRLDLIQKVVDADMETGIIRMCATPDPRRYTKIDREEPGEWYLDRYFSTVFDLNDFVDAAPGLPIFSSDRSVESIVEYASERKLALKSELTSGIYVAPSQKARPHESIDLHEERELAFLSVDICGSTALRRSDPESFEIAYRILIQELGATVGQFQGNILKTTGDGFIAFLDMPSFTVLADSAFDLGGCLLQVLHGAINPALMERGLPKLAARVGADYGPARLRKTTVPLTGFSTLEVTSDALNRAVKIEQSCEPDTFRVGYDLYRIGHVQWLERSHSVDFDGLSVGIAGYQVFEVR